MGDVFQTLVATHVSAGAAPAARDALLQFLIFNGFLAPEASDCILGEGEGHRPGPKYSRAVAQQDHFLLQLATNGVSVDTGRIVALDPQGETTWICFACHTKNDNGAGLSKAISGWYEGDDAAAIDCTSCSASTPLMQLVAEPPIAVGHVAVTFWNWPPLEREFIHQIENTIQSAVTLVYGKL